VLNTRTEDTSRAIISNAISEAGSASQSPVPSTSSKITRFSSQITGSGQIHTPLVHESCLFEISNVPSRPKSTLHTEKFKIQQKKMEKNATNTFPRPHWTNDNHGSIDAAH
jgi:hypothetical protein